VGVSLVAVFDFDMTLLDTSSLKTDRDARNWAAVKRGAQRLSFQPDVAAALSELSQAGATVAIASSAPRWYLDSFLERLGARIDVTLGYGDADPLVRPGLSYRARIKAAQLELLQRRYPGAALVFVGDDADDAAGAAAAAVPFVHACWGGGCVGVSAPHCSSVADVAQAVRAAAGME
jgi:phosphoglycolate phosphatase-like HAD superfamily hydrolase